jgi:beta-glucosidase
MLSGRPLMITEELDNWDAFVAAWLPGTEGDGISDVLFGDYNPTGKLSFSWPRDISQIPSNYTDENYNPLFKFNYGLTY